MARMRIRIDARACEGCQRVEDAHETHGGGTMCADRIIRWVEPPAWLFGSGWPTGRVPKNCPRRTEHAVLGRMRSL